MTVTINGTDRIYRHTLDELRHEIDVAVSELPDRVTAHPGRVGDYANAISKLRGEHDTLRYLEDAFAKIELWAVEQRWTQQQLLLAWYDELAGMALLAPGDTAGGRGGDAQRSYIEGRREVLSHVRNRVLLRSEWFPGNELSALNDK